EEAIGLARKPIDLDEHERRGREHDEQTGEDARADEGKADAARIAQEGPVIRQELSWADGVSVALLDRFGEAGPGADQHQRRETALHEKDEVPVEMRGDDAAEHRRDKRTERLHRG